MPDEVKFVAELPLSETDLSFSFVDLVWFVGKKCFSMSNFVNLRINLIFGTAVAIASALLGERVIGDMGVPPGSSG